MIEMKMVNNLKQKIRTLIGIVGISAGIGGLVGGGCDSNNEYVWFDEGEDPGLKVMEIVGGPLLESGILDSEFEDSRVATGVRATGTGIRDYTRNQAIRDSGTNINIGLGGFIPGSFKNSYGNE